uniref:M23 family metallopeptidase n=1 Tax=Leptospira interrogans TaxID=173 RepID=UPI001F3C159D
VNIDDTVFAGSRELKGSVSVKGIPVEVSYGMQYLVITSGFDISKIGYNFKLKGLGTSYVDSQLSGVSQKYSVYTKDIQDRIERQAKSNDEEMDKKGFVFNVLNGMSGGQKVTQAVEGEIRSRVTGAIAEASGLPASFVGALVGGGSVKDAMKAYEKSVTTEAISKATGIPGWYLDQKMAEKEANHAMTTSFSYNMATSMVGSLKYSPPLLAAQALIPGLKEDVNKFVDHVGREAYKNRETIDTAVTVAMTVAAPFSGGASLVALAAYKAAEGAVEGGVLGALAGAANVGNAFLYEFTGGTVSYNLSYSYADGFGASIGGGWKIANGLGVGATLSYNENQGFGGSVGLQAGTSALSFNAGLSYSQRDGVSANAGVGIGLGGKKPTGSLNLGVSYNRQDGLGTSVGISSNNNKITHGMGLNITRSEYGGWGADVSTDNYGPGNLSGGLAYTQRDGFTVSLNVNGTNAFNYNSQSGLSGNGDFMSQYVMNNGLAQGVSDESDTSEPNSAQQHNNAEQGAQAIAGAGETLLGGRRNEGEGGATHYYDKDGNMRIRVTDSNGDSYYRAATAEEAHRIQNNNGYTMASETGVSRQLSAADIAEFKADWRKESPAQTDASLAALKSAGYDTSGLEKFVQDYRNGKVANNQSSTPSTTTTQTTHQNQPGVFQNILNSVTSGARNLWNRITGGGTTHVTHQTAPVVELSNGAKLPFENEGSGYGKVRHLYDSETGESKTTGPHTGLDQPQASGAPVPVVDDGKVILVNRDFRTRTEGGKGYGAVVVVQHNNGILTLYGHNSKINVNEGDLVKKGQVISAVGNTGNSWGAHMHYEVRTGNDITKGNFYGNTKHHDPSAFDWNQWK